MGRFMVIIPDDLEKQLRVKVVEKYGGKKGALGEVVTEALRLWLKSQK